MAGRPLGAIVNAAAGAVAVAALAAVGGPSVGAPLFPRGHVYGAGEQQVYAIDRRASLTVRVRDRKGHVRSASVRLRDRLSIALTVEGFAGDGAPTLAAATVVAHAQARPRSGRVVSGAFSTGASSLSAQSSPTIAADGSSPSKQLGDLTPAALALAGAPDDLAAALRPWQSTGHLYTPVGILAVSLTSVAAIGANGSGTGVIVINSQGNGSVSGKVGIPKFGHATLRGADIVSARSYVDAFRHLLLGAIVRSNGRGAAIISDGRRGEYKLTLAYTAKLVRYVNGVPSAAAAPPFGDASLGGTASADSSLRSPAPLSSIAAAAPTDASYVPSPLPAQSATPLPQASLPPIPISFPSDAPLAVPPPGPTPTI
ncbi:MAG: hypothetical protein M3T49_04210 [Candidatus Eremiobacteraeota bacterium]|nr:hypothetical protein [Candidatus Eremiobacteraeota bacterium]